MIILNEHSLPHGVPLSFCRTGFQPHFCWFTSPFCSGCSHSSKMKIILDFWKSHGFLTSFLSSNKYTFMPLCLSPIKYPMYLPPRIFNTLQIRPCSWYPFGLPWGRCSISEESSIWYNMVLTCFKQRL